jgi:hypothetical protein
MARIAQLLDIIIQTSLGNPALSGKGIASMIRKGDYATSVWVNERSQHQ